MTEPSSTAVRYRLDHLSAIEAEAIFVIREVAAECERPVLMFSGGKDSIVLAHLARKAFSPGRVPFPFLHVDTGHNFPETLASRDRFIADLGVELIVRTVGASIRLGRAQEKKDSTAGRNALQSITLVDAISESRFDAALGVARRDEGERFRIFPLSNWTELDVWLYLKQEHLSLPSLYFSHERDCVRRGSIYLAQSEYLVAQPGDELRRERVRFRTIGDMTCTGAVLSEAANLDDIVAELSVSGMSERGGRADDQRSDSAMEDRKREGYF